MLLFLVLAEKSYWRLTFPEDFQTRTGDPEGFVLGAGEARFKHYSRPRPLLKELTCYTGREEELPVHSRKSQGRIPGPSV